MATSYSGGGAYVTDEKPLADRVRHLSTQAREPAPHYEHVDIGYNYRMSNVLAALVGPTGFGLGGANGISGLALVPIPAALPLFGTALGLMAFLGWKRRSAA